eukprot:6733868-Lingulodinium_polyedra.AAC.1
MSAGAEVAKPPRRLDVGPAAVSGNSGAPSSPSAPATVFATSIVSRAAPATSLDLRARAAAARPARAICCFQGP